LYLSEISLVRKTLLLY